MIVKTDPKNPNTWPVLTLWQPWAILLAHPLGWKDIETRPKPVSYRGPVFIHAAAAFPKSARDLCETQPFKKALEAIGFEHWSQLPLGSILGAFDVEDCVASWGTDNLGRAIVAHGCPHGTTTQKPVFISSTETQLGNYDITRYAWIGTNHRLLKQPISYTNGQGYYLRYKGRPEIIHFMEVPGQFDPKSNWFTV